jgi:integrase
MCKHVFSLINKLFNDAIHHFEFLDISPVKRKHKPKVPVRERLFLPPSEAIKLLNLARPHYLGPAIWLGIIAGLRTEAIIGLQWDAIDLDKREIHIKQCWKRKIRRLDPFPKGKAWERIPMPQLLADYLLETRRSTDDRSEFVARGQEGGMLDYQKLYCGLKKLCLQAGVTVVSPHGLRHSMSELYIESAGASMEDIRRLLNQKETSTTAGYIHRTPERLAQLGQALNAQLVPLGLMEAPKLRVVR